MLGVNQCFSQVRQTYERCQVVTGLYYFTANVHSTHTPASTHIQGEKIHFQLGTNILITIWNVLEMIVFTLLSHALDEMYPWIHKHDHAGSLSNNKPSLSWKIRMPHGYIWVDTSRLTNESVWFNWTKFFWSEIVQIIMDNKWRSLVKSHMGCNCFYTVISVGMLINIR